MRENIVERGRTQLAIWRMRIACLIPKATNTHSEYVIPIAFPLQQRLHEHPCTLRYASIGCVSCCCIPPLQQHLHHKTTIRTNIVMSEPFVILPVALCALTTGLQRANFHAAEATVLVLASAHGAGRAD